jgi:predicted ATPase
VPLPGFAHNLPAPLNNFIGREKQIEDLKEALANARLVTLTGSGGTGKSRLSLQVAAQVTGDYADGVWLVELSPVGDEARIRRWSPSCWA